VPLGSDKSTLENFGLNSDDLTADPILICVILYGSVLRYELMLLCGRFWHIICVHIIRTHCTVVKCKMKTLLTE